VAPDPTSLSSMAAEQTVTDLGRPIGRTAMWRVVQGGFRDEGDEIWRSGWDDGSAHRFRTSAGLKPRCLGQSIWHGEKQRTSNIMEKGQIMGL